MLEQIDKGKIIFSLYNGFRKCCRLKRDLSPIENFFSDPRKSEKPIYIKDPEDDAEWTSELWPPEPIKIVFEFDKCATDDEIKSALKQIQKEALDHKDRHWASLLWAKNTAGKPLPSIQTKLSEIGRCLRAYRIYSDKRSKAAVSKDRGNFRDEYDTRQRQHSTERVNPYLKRAELLMAASAKGFHAFIEEAMKPVGK